MEGAWIYPEGVRTRSERVEYHAGRVRRELTAYTLLDRIRTGLTVSQILTKIERLRKNRAVVEAKIAMLSKQQKDKFRETLSRRPRVGDVIRSSGPGGVEVVRQPKPDRGNGESFIYFVRVAVDPTGSGWFLSDDPRGIVCLLLPSAVAAARRSGGRLSRIRVVRWNSRGTALVCGPCMEE